MDKEEIERLIARKKKEIKQLLELKELLKSEHIERQIDMRLDDLSKLYKEVKKRKKQPNPPTHRRRGFKKG